MHSRIVVLSIVLALALSAMSGVMAQGTPAAEFNQRGIEAYNADNFSEAVRQFEKAYELSPDNETVRHNLCNAHQSLASQLAKENKFSAATKPLITAIGIEPENPSPLIQLGSYYLQIDDTKQAIFRIEEAVELKAGDLTAHELLGEAYYRDNDLPAALIQWEWVLSMDPKRKSLQARYDKAIREETVENGFSRTGSRHFKLSSPGSLPGLMRSRVLTLLERAYFDIGRKFNGVYPPAPIQVIFYTHEKFAEATQQGEHVAALYDGKIRVPYTDAEGQQLEEDDLKRRLVHEYVHVVVRNIANGKTPWWLNEGLAENLSKDLGEKERRIIQNAYEKGVEFSLRDLEAHQLKILDPDGLSLAYAQSHAVVNLLWGRWGASRVVSMLQSIAQGTSPEMALQDTYRRSYQALEDETLRSL
jgi:hypothetical protein